MYAVSKKKCNLKKCNAPKCNSRRPGKSCSTLHLCSHHTAFMKNDRRNKLAQSMLNRLLREVRPHRGWWASIPQAQPLLIGTCPSADPLPWRPRQQKSAPAPGSPASPAGAERQHTDVPVGPQERVERCRQTWPGVIRGFVRAQGAGAPSSYQHVSPISGPCSHPHSPLLYLDPV